MSTTQETELLPPERGVAVREQPSMAVGKAMSLDELHEQLEFIRNVMKREMREGQDYGKVPGCGDKPCLLQPGAQKLCMTFQLMNEVAKEDINDFPGMHREYSITVRLKSATGRSWEGVGTCSTMEGKYRFRTSGRKCPDCGKETILKSKNPGEGFFCWAKKGGCGAKFAADDDRITGQESGRVEHDNPPDFWNTVRKMAFKRALVHAAINATNTSELWTQDVEEMAENAQASAPARPTQPAPAPAPARPAAPAKPIPCATPEQKAKMIASLDGVRDTAEEFFIKIDWLLPTEKLEDLPLRYCPATQAQGTRLDKAIEAFANGMDAMKPYEPNQEPLAPKTPKAAKPAAAPTTAPAAKDAEWFMDVVVPVPHAGQKRDEYLKSPDTIGSLYNARHDDEEARRRLFGFLHNYEPKGWEKRDGTKMPPNEADKKFREALDAFGEWFAAEHPDEMDAN